MSLVAEMEPVPLTADELDQSDRLSKLDARLTEAMRLGADQLAVSWYQLDELLRLARVGLNLSAAVRHVTEKAGK